jgi:hypothetical protein
MSDVIKNAMNYRNRLKAELAKVEEFLRMAEEFSNEGDDLRLTSRKQAEAAAPAPESAAKPQTPFERMRAAATGGAGS